MVRDAVRIILPLLVHEHDVWWMDMLAVPLYWGFWLPNPFRK